MSKVLNAANNDVGLFFGWDYTINKQEKTAWQLVNRKADFFTKRIDSRNELNRIDSDRELECSTNCPLPVYLQFCTSLCCLGSSNYFGHSILPVVSTCDELCRISFLSALAYSKPENRQLWWKNLGFGDGWTLKNLRFRCWFPIP